MDFGTTHTNQQNHINLLEAFEVLTSIQQCLNL